MPGKYEAGAGEVVLYALSTCIWCRKTKKLLERLGVDYRLVEVDRLPREERGEARDEMERWSDAAGFPLLVIRAEKAIGGYRPDEIERELG